MSITSELYIRQRDGTYASVKDGAILPIGWHQIVLSVLLQLYIGFMPSFVRNFIHSYIWTLKRVTSGSVALVTGGGSGFGKAMCFCLAREGCKVAVADIDEESAFRTASEIRKMGLQAMGLRVDVTDFKSVQQLRIDVEQRVGVVDILVDNEVVPANSQMSAAAVETLRRIVGADILEHCWMTREFKPAIIQRIGRKIFGISSRFVSKLQK